MGRMHGAGAATRELRGGRRASREIRNTRPSGPRCDPNQLPLAFEGPPAPARADAPAATTPRAAFDREWLAEAARALLIVGVILGGLLL